MNGEALHQLIRELYPIVRSITGEGVRESISLLQTLIPLELHEVPTGASVLDWEVPDEWIFRKAYIENEAGERLVDARDSSLHVMNYSIATNQQLTRAELEPHLHSLPDQPDAIPYRTTYYDRQWGFCLSQQQRDNLGPGPFNVVIDAEHRPGSLSYAELLIPGQSSDQILISTHVCHPALANDNLSGMVLATALAQYLLKQPTPALSWRFVFVPGTIGAISWLAQNKTIAEQVVAGMVITGLGDDNAFTWKEPRSKDTWIDNVVKLCLNQVQPDTHSIIPFGPYGYDERQYCSPGFNLPVGRLTRGVHGTFPEYHTSLDNLDFVKPARLEESLQLLMQIADTINQDVCFENLKPYGEPQLGKRGLYGSVGALNNPGDAQMAMLWLLNQSDGQTSISAIAQKSGLSLQSLIEVAELLRKEQLIEVRCHAHRISKTKPSHTAS